MAQERFGIINGPSKNQLLQSFERAYSSARTFVCFSLPNNGKLRGWIVSLEYEDGSGHNFNFKGYFMGTLYKGFYNAHSRKGTIIPIE